MKRFITLLAAMPLLFAACNLSAQSTIGPLAVRASIVEIDNNGLYCDVFSIVLDGQKQYYMSAGHVYMGDEVVKVQIEPMTEMFVFLGDTMDEAIEAMQNMKLWFNLPSGTINEVDGSFSIAQPKLEKETIRVTSMRPLLTRQLEFAVMRGDAVVAAHVIKSDFNSLLSGLKTYRKLHPKEL